ncbi:ABC transporter ATP-binding protein [Caballeronia sp. dw_19]|uniref:ABC transporter ATP-binding protein n=1 Tax=Caballeronia sp. dw_19 TaxID=2719791 RepID=UPI001BD35ABC|nr:ABC transporter ATP-binding protein [Caballeronia sp. dw_19]
MSTMPTGPAIHAHALIRSFGSVHAVRGISFDIARGEIFGLVGPDGAGKTTIMRMLAGVLRPDSGEIRLEDIDVVAAPERAKAALSYMPQRFGLYEDLTVAENIAFYGELFSVPRKTQRARSDQLLEAAGLVPFRQRLAGQLSGGMKQKLGLVCALIHTPRVLLLDEPTTGVDPVSRRDFWEILYNLRESGVTIVLSTAYMDEAERCSRLALLHAGEIRQCDTPARLKQAMPGALLAIMAPDPRAVHDALVDAPGVLGTLLMGDRVHVRVDDAARRTPELGAFLASKAIVYTTITPVEPGIEDVFVALVGSGSAA